MCSKEKKEGGFYNRCNWGGQTQSKEDISNKEISFFSSSYKVLSRIAPFSLQGNTKRRLRKPVTV
jgi:hypothetical protein